MAKLLARKHAAYGPRSKTAEILGLLFPRGVQPKEYRKFSIIMEIVENLCRIGNGHDDDSWVDILGFATLGAVDYDGAADRIMGGNNEDLA